jgi:predicted transcriptional regulator
MAQRLVLSTAGIKSPLDMGEDEQPARSETPASRAASPRQPEPHSRRSAEASPRAEADPGPAPFYGIGRPLQTSIALDDDRASLLDELARAAGVSANVLAVAALQAGLPAEADDARGVIVDERVNRAGVRSARIERNLRLPEHLRARIDELTAAARGQLPRATRADLINAALRRGLPADAQRAAELVADHARRVERAAAA